MDIDRLRVLRALRLKGRVLPADVAGAAGAEESVSAALLQELSTQGYVEEARGRLKLTPAGREHLDALLTSERETVDGDIVRRLYGEFDDHNTALKSLMTRWQLKAEDTPNDHTDLAYDRAVIDDLVLLDNGFAPLLSRMVAVAPRLGHYPRRFTGALARIEAGDHSWFAKPLADSYHTVWFELHEDLIGLAGLSRAEEAAAGRAG
jgi:DNA-binding MarR family transcriptional regulator